MVAKCIKSLLVAVFSVFLAVSVVSAQDHESTEPATAEHHEKGEGKLDPAKIIMDHIKDAHEFHFFSVGDFHAVIHLPVILYSPTKGFSMFSSSRFGHEGEAAGHQCAVARCAEPVAQHEFRRRLSAAPAERRHRMQIDQQRRPPPVAAETSRVRERWRS